MTPISGITRSTAAYGPRPGGPSRPQPADNVETSRALIPLQPAERSDNATRTSGRPCASFLVHLIATTQQLPQTRERRRADCADVIAAYRAANASAPPPLGGRIRCSR